MQPIQAIRGMNDILPERTHIWRFVEEVICNILDNCGYNEIRTPVLEKTELFERSIGEVTDIVEKEMYTFSDRNGERLTLRPEGTAGCVRAALENNLLRNPALRLWYRGAMFRHERPQKGRYRQFHQFGIETFGFIGPDIDAELILITARILAALGITNLRLEINSLGSAESRAKYREDLISYLSFHKDQLDPDSQRRLLTNPLRILDSKNPIIQELLADAPRLIDYLDLEAEAHFAGLRDILDAAHIAYVVNPFLVRGLDYYTHTVFEWVASNLGAQGTVCAGGRFDQLVAQLGGSPTPAIGCALGMERLVALVEEQAPNARHKNLWGYVTPLGAPATRAAFLITEQLRNALPEARIQIHCGGGTLKAQLRHADKSGARLALILGEAEMNTESIILKDLRGDLPQQNVAWGTLAEFLAKLFLTH